jgi:predicted Zn-dependent protease with MMP-like domain
MDPISRGRFERLVADALDLLPDELADLVDNVVIAVADRHPDEPDLLGLYEGVPLTERHDYGGLVLPDRITVYRLACCEFCEDEEELVGEVAITVVHEIAHHFGIDDGRLHELGWG